MTTQPIRTMEPIRMMEAAPASTAVDRDGERLAAFYEEHSSVDSIVRALSAERVDVAGLSARDLYTRGLDCQNLGGFAVLEHVAEIAGEHARLESSHRVLDVGSGLGGPARYLADRFGCAVDGIELLQLRVDTARLLSQMAGGAQMGGGGRAFDRVRFEQGEATRLPAIEGTYDQAWALDVTVHIRAKAALFGEIARVLRAGGMLILHDQPGPLPKAMAPLTRRAPYHAPSLPHLVRCVEDAGLRVIEWRETTELVRGQLAERLAFHESRPASGDGASRRRHERRIARLAAYVEALSGEGRTGVLIARKPS